MARKNKVVTALGTVRIFASLGLIAVVVAGALGYGDTIKICAGAGGVVLGATLKATHIFA